MKWSIVFIVLLSLLISSPSYSIDLDSNHMVTNIIKSLDEERDRWIIRNGDIYYINRDITKADRDESWPEYIEECLVYITYSLLRNDGYMAMKIPVKGFIENKDLEVKIRQVLYEELHNRYGIRMPKEKIAVKETIDEVDKNVSNKL